MIRSRLVVIVANYFLKLQDIMSMNTGPKGK